MISRLHHVGLEVADLDEAVAFYEGQGFKLFKKFDYEAIQAKAAMLHRGGSAGLELWFFVNHDDPLVEKIRLHTAFASDDLDADLQTFLQNGYAEAIPISSGTVVRRFAYVKDAVGNIIEILEPLESEDDS